MLPHPLASFGLHLLPGLSSSGTSPFGVLPPAYKTLRHVPHWLVNYSHSHFVNSYCCCPLHVLSLLFHSFPSTQCFSSQDDGRSPRVDHRITTVSFPLSPYLISVDNNTSHLFSFMCLRLVSNGCFCFVSVTGPCRFHVVICFNSFFLLPSLLIVRFSYLLSLFFTRCCSDLPFLIPFQHGGSGLG